MTDFAKNNVGVVTVLSGLASAVAGTIMVMIYLNGLSMQIRDSHDDLSNKIATIASNQAVTDQKVSGLIEGQNATQGQTDKIWTVVHSTADVTAQHTTDIAVLTQKVSEVQQSVNKDAQANRAEDAK